MQYFLSFYYGLENTEGLLSGLGALGLVSDDVETNSLGKRTALSNGDDVSILDTEGGGAVSGNVLVPLLKTTVLSDVVEVVPTDDNGSLHLGGDNLSLQDSASDGNITGEGALLVNITTLNGGIGGLDAKTNILDKAHGLGARCIHGTLACHEDSILLLVCLFVL